MHMHAVTLAAGSARFLAPFEAPNVDILTAGENNRSRALWERKMVSVKMISLQPNTDPDFRSKTSRWHTMP